MAEVTEEVGTAPAPDEVQTSIEVKDGIMRVTINLKRGQVNCYGTLQYAQEMGSRFYLTQELAKRKQEEQDQAAGRVRLTLPGRK
jgi:hypothetical protein